MQNASPNAAPLPNELAGVCGRLGCLLEAGVPLLPALRACARELPDAALRTAVGAIADHIEAGGTCSEAMGRQPNLWPPTVLAMIEAAELQATFPQTLARIAQGFADGTLNRPAGLETSAPSGDLDLRAVKLVNQIIHQAIQANASDVHLNGGEPEDLRVRYRIDGVLREQEPVPGHLRRAVLARLKVLAGLSTTKGQRPQDSRISLVVAGKSLDLAVSTVPCADGDSVVLRLLNPAFLPSTIADLEFAPEQLDLLRRWCRQDGLIVVTGPLGSGKTTTLYALLQELNTPAVKVVTVEDPVRHLIKGVCQLPIQPAQGLTFAAALRAQLRQAPNVVMVGDLRDVETAALTVSAALTGHLVLTAMHTQDAPAALQRLLEIGIPAFQVNSAVTGVVAQRLVRRICPDCRVAYTPPAWVTELVGAGPDTQFFHGKGCEKCGQTGYRGRLALWELLPLSDPLRLALARDEGVDELRRLALAAGHQTLRAAGLAKAAAGLTTLDEVLKVCG